MEILTEHVRLLFCEYKLLTIMNYVYFFVQKSLQISQLKQDS